MKEVSVDLQDSFTRGVFASIMDAMNTARERKECDKQEIEVMLKEYYGRRLTDGEREDLRLELTRLRMAEVIVIVRVPSKNNGHVVRPGKKFQELVELLGKEK